MKKNETLEQGRAKEAYEMKEEIIYRYGKDNIFDFSFMQDFTTISCLKESGQDISKIEYQDEDDFYSHSEKKSYTEEELFKKFNIKKVNNNDDI